MAASGHPQEPPACSMTNGPGTGRMRGRPAPPDDDQPGATVIRHTQGRPVPVRTRDGRLLFSMVLDGPADAAATVVFEAGAAASRSTWSLVQTRTAAFARAVVYDRAGLGRSPADPVGRSLDRMADDLCDVLDRSGTGPFVLVGHSAGGPIVRLAASRRLERVAGLVLVDPSDEAARTLLGPGFRAAERLAVALGRVLAGLGLLRPLFGWMVEAMPAADVREDLEREGFTTRVARTQAAQARTFLDELAAWRTAPPQLGDVPLTVVSGARPGNGMSRRLRAEANAAHAARAAAGPAGRHVLARRSAHEVPITEPGLVAEEIRRLVAGAARAGGVGAARAAQAGAPGAPQPGSRS